jgi:hypothetical protein
MDEQTKKLMEGSCRVLNAKGARDWPAFVIRVKRRKKAIRQILRLSISHQTNEQKNVITNRFIHVLR